MIARMGRLLPTTDGPARVLCGFNIFGYEDARAVVEAGEELSAPILLMVNRATADFMPPEIIGPMLRKMAERSSAPVGVHLDHAWDLEVLKRALDSGFTSVMFDGSKRSLPENIEMSRKARVLADTAGASLEGEVGTVPYNDMGETEAELTRASDAALFARETGVDALAVSVGNVHRLIEPGARIDFQRLSEIEAAVDLPLVIHGASGLPDDDVRRLLGTKVAKFNVGTRLRQAFGAGLRAYLAENPEDFDKLRILRATLEPVRAAAVSVLRRTGW